jgi:hypothetical protein
MNINEIFPGPPMSVTVTQKMMENKPSNDLAKVLIISCLCAFAGLYFYTRYIREEL